MAEDNVVEQCVMVCPQCEGEGHYADGTDEAACTTFCTRCGTNGWIVDLARHRLATQALKEAEDNVAVEQIDRDTLDEIWITALRHQPPKDSADDAMLQILARHRLAAQAHEPCADVVEVRKVETVTGDFMQDEGEPFWRIEIGGYCADFDHEQAARNFAAAIAAMRPESERAGIVAWLRSLPNDEWYPDHVADAIERGDHIKEPSHD